MKNSSIDTYRIMAVAAFGSTDGGLARAFSVPSAEADPCGTAMAAMRPSCTIVLPKEYCPAGFIDCRPLCIADFEPATMLDTQPWLSALAEALGIVCSAEREGLAHCEVEERLQQLLPGLPLDYAPPPREVPPPEQKASHAVIDDLLSLVDTGGDGRSAGAGEVGSFRALRMQLEEVLRQCLRLIVNNPGFRALEASWRGAETMMRQSGGDGMERAVEFLLVSADEGGISQLLGELRELEPSRLPNLLLLDVSLENSPRGMALLEELITTADRLMLPVCASVGADFFGLGSWGEIGRLSYLQSFLAQAQYARWRKLQVRPGAGDTMLFLNRFPARPRHRGLAHHQATIDFREKEQLWVNPQWAFGALLATALTRTGWPMGAGDRRVAGVAGAALQEQEPIPLEMAVADDRFGQFHEAGFNPLAAAKGDDGLFLRGLSSIGGEDAEFRLFFTMLVAFLIRLRESAGVADEGTAAWVRECLTSFLCRDGAPESDGLRVELAYDEGSGADLLKLALMPPAGIRGGGLLEFSFNW